MSWITVGLSKFRVSSGTIRCYRSSQTGERGFCENCGSQMTFKNSGDLDRIDIAIGTLDRPESFAPDNQIWCSERLPYLFDMNGLRSSETAATANQRSVSSTTEIILRDTHDLAVDKIIALYRANGWSAAEKPEQLYKGLLNSSALISAWDGVELLGLANAITDNHLVVYYPHMLIRPDRQGEGVGQLIMQEMQRRYGHLHQQVLIAYDSAVEFYEKCDFTVADDCQPMKNRVAGGEKPGPA